MITLLAKNCESCKKRLKFSNNFNWFMFLYCSEEDLIFFEIWKSHYRIGIDSEAISLSLMVRNRIITYKYLNDSIETTVYSKNGIKLIAYFNKFIEASLVTELLVLL